MDDDTVMEENDPEVSFLAENPKSCRSIKIESFYQKWRRNGFFIRGGQNKTEKTLGRKPVACIDKNAKQVKYVAGERLKVAKQYDAERQHLEHQQDEMEEKPKRP